MNFLKKLYFSILYFKNPPWDTGESPPELLDFIQNHSPGSALDLGCGTGTNAITLAQNGWQTTGVDFVKKAVDKARSKAERRDLQITFIQGDVTKIGELTGKFDLVLDIGCFHSLSGPEKRRYIENLNKYLSEKGNYLIYAWLDNDENGTSGITESDIKALSKYLALIHRKDGSERGLYPSVWLTFERKN